MFCEIAAFSAASAPPPAAAANALSASERVELSAFGVHIVFEREPPLLFIPRYLERKSERFSALVSEALYEMCFSYNESFDEAEAGA